MILIIGCTTGSVFSQQSQPFTQYLFNRYLLNPAACGSNGYTMLGLTVKDQWTGFGDAPFNQTLTLQIRVPREGLFRGGSSSPPIRMGGGGYRPENVGLGLALFNDVRGPLRTTGSHFTYAYHMENGMGQLSFGLTASLFQLSVDRSKVRTELDWDMFLDNNKLSSFVPDVSFGLHYTQKKFYVGLSASHLFQSYLTFGGRASNEFRIERQYTFIGGYIFEPARELSIVPKMQLKYVERGAIQADINIIGYHFDLFWGGFSFRTGGGGAVGSAAIIFGVRYNNYYFGYAFDYTLSEIQRYTFGSHELMVNISLGRATRFYQYIRRYEFQDSEQQWRKQRSRGLVSGH